MPKRKRILLTGGGSGGHIIPNLAVASVIHDKEKNVEIRYIASRRKLDAKLLKGSGMRVYPIFSGKLRRYFSWQNFIDPLFVLLGFLQSLWILICFRPHVIFSKGGYVSLPVVLAAFIFRIPIILHESDSRMGLANRIAARLANKVCVAFPALKKGKKYILTGNPIRSEIALGNKKQGYQLTGFTTSLPVILVWGGSQGAKEVNNLLEHAFEKLTEHFQIVHITGAGKHIKKRSSRYIAFEYLDEDLKHIYAITDLVIGRAGANSLYEVAFMEKPNVLIPLPNADQQRNANYFETMGGSLVYKKGDNLFDLVKGLWQNTSLKNKMKKALKKLAKPKATQAIVDIILSTSIKTL